MRDGFCIAALQSIYGAILCFPIKNRDLATFWSVAHTECYAWAKKGGSPLARRS